MDGTARFPFASGWYGTDLPGYRNCDDTYCFFPYADLPPVGEPSETLDWLGPLDETTDQQMQVHRDRPTKSGQLQEIEAAAGRLGLSLPASFLRLMASPALQDRIPSCTANYFELAKAIVPYPGSEDIFIIRFLNEQQNILTWYLYLTRAGASGVIVTPYWLEELTGVQGEDAPGTTMTATWGEGPDAVTKEYTSGPLYTQVADPQALQQVVAGTFVCGPSFVSFLYRYWLENVIWFKLNDASSAQLTEEERRYLAHYRGRATVPNHPDPVAPTPVELGLEHREGKDSHDHSLSSEGDKGGAVMTRVLGLIGIILGAVLGLLGALPTGWFGQLSGVGGSSHTWADALVAAGVVLLLLGIVGLVRRPSS